MSFPRRHYLHTWPFFSPLFLWLSPALCVLATISASLLERARKKQAKFEVADAGLEPAISQSTDLKCQCSLTVVLMAELHQPWLSQIARS